MSDLASGMSGITAESGKAVGSAMKGAGGDDGDGMAELFKINQIWYRAPPTLSLVSKRTLLVNQAQRSTYDKLATDVISFVFNSGELYVNCASSYLYFKIGYNNPALYARSKAIIAQGNALSLFEEITLLSASGTEVCREQNKGLRESFKFYYTNTQDYINTYGQAQGGTYGSYSEIHDGVGPTFGYTVGQSINLDSNFKDAIIDGTESSVRPVTGEIAKNFWGHGATNLNRSTVYMPLTGTGTDQRPDPAQSAVFYTVPTLDYLEFVIPLDTVLGCFKPYMNCLFPAGALAGSKLEMRLKNPTESLQFMAGIKEVASSNAETGDTKLDALIKANWSALYISNTYIVLDSFQLQDSVLQILNQVAAGQNGISVMFDTYDHTSLLVSGSGTVEASVQQARSRISKSWCVVRDSANTMNPYINSLAAEGVIRRPAASAPAGFTSLGDIPITVTVSGVPQTVNYTGNRGSLSYQFQRGYQITDADPEYSPGPGFSTEIQVRARAPTTDTTNYGKPVVSSYQAQLGSLFFPQQPLTTPVEYYTNALYMWGKSTPDRKDNCAVTYQDFLGGLGVGLYTNGSPTNPTLNGSMGKMLMPYGLAVYGVLAEKSSLLQLSGLPLSNARLLRHKFTFSTPPQSNSNRVIDTFTDFTRMFKLYLGGRIVVRE